MTTTTPTPTRSPTERRPSPGSRRFGYVIAIALNAALLVIANNILAWGWLPFLTEELNQVLPLINVSIVATIVVNAVYLVFDPVWFSALAEMWLLSISMAVTVRMYRVFPFDFSAYEFDWAQTARILLILAMVGIGIGFIANLVKLVTAAVRAR